MQRCFVESFFPALVCTAIVLTSMQLSAAQVRSSNNYQLQSDSINIGGGFSTSTNFNQESTVGEIATGPSDSSNYSLRAGYQQMQAVFLSMTDPTDVVMDATLPGITGGTANGSTTFTVVTDSPSGYTVSIQAENDPAMVRSDSAETIDDYDDGGTPDFNFSLTPTDAHFGYSVNGIDIAQDFLQAGSVCDTGSTDTIGACWTGLTTVDFTIVERNSANQPTGSTTTIEFRVGIGGSNPVPSGLYIATTTLTALPL